MANYNPSTRNRIADIKDGLLVETTDMAFGVFGAAQAELFTVYNRIKIHAMWLEVTATSLVGAGALMNFTWTSTTPTVALQDISAASLTVHGMDRGERVIFPGVSLATAAILSTEGVTFFPTDMDFMVGIAPSATVTSVGTIGLLPTIAVLTVGTAKAGIYYTPVDDGAYVEALL